MSEWKPALPGTVVASITINYHDDGALSVGGNIGDQTLALALLAHASDAIKNHKQPRPLIVPNRDVVVPQDAEAYPFGPICGPTVIPA